MDTDCAVATWAFQRNDQFMKQFEDIDKLEGETRGSYIHRAIDEGHV
jgi:hypothetical protein